MTAASASKRALALGKSALENLSARIGTRHLFKLVYRRDQVIDELRSIPDRMQKVTNQARLVLDLLDDFNAGRYQDIPWHSIAIAAVALVYSISPADVIPDTVPFLGSLDDILVISVAMRLIRRDLKKYCEFKGYDPSEYF